MTSYRLQRKNALQKNALCFIIRPGGSMNQVELKEIPYGISDYSVIREKNFYYVDKTAYLKEIEKAGSYHFFIRPRRFGKSLFLSMMKCYYDIYYKDQFEEFFKGTWIFDNPTKERGKYLVLSLNFSEVSPSLHHMETSFLALIKDSVQEFIEKYRSLLSVSKTMSKYETSIDKSIAPSDIMGHLNRLVKSAGRKMAVIIDEYDNFANNLLTASGAGAYHDLTHTDGFLRTFFSVLKAGTEDVGSPLSRLFITGVSPVTMDDVTSGFNIGKNISRRKSFNRMLGFTAEEVTEMLRYYNGMNGVTLNTQFLLPVMTDWYGNYRFSEDDEVTLFNSDMVLYFLDNYLYNGKFPDQLLDRNVRIDYGKLRHLIIIDRDKPELPGTNGNFSKLKQIIEDGETFSKIADGFPLEKMKEEDNFKSLLFYFGLLTIKDRERRLHCLKIPNETVKQLYFDYITEAYRETGVFSLDLSRYSILMDNMAFDGAWRPLFEFITGVMKESLALRDLISGEKAMQSFLYAYLSLSDLFVVHSEKELNKGYADLVLEAFTAKYPKLNYSFLLELKYVKAGIEADDPKTAKLVTEAEAQINRYTLDKKFIKTIGNTKLVKLILIFSGHKAIYIEEVTRKP